MVRLNARIPVLLSFVLALAPVAAAEGLHLKLSADTARVGADQPVKVKLVAVALRTLSLPAAPVFLVDDGTGARPESGAKALDGAGRVEVTPDKSHTGGYGLILSKPGTYKIQAEYRVNERVVRSNKVTVEVTAGAERAGQ